MTLSIVFVAVLWAVLMTAWAVVANQKLSVLKEDVDALAMWAKAVELRRKGG